ncbi:MAG: hypothetical protein Ct9H90mP25_0460 [Gammaproteobacteria bacterium]|nr:MAG: hypothetical protein Ct9H90mP25_0460 [Gammaproteobacteria bacterium]
MVIGQTQNCFAQYQPDPLRYESQITAFEEQDFIDPPLTMQYYLLEVLVFVSGIIPPLISPRLPQ